MKKLCRVCGTELQLPVVKLRGMPLTDDFVRLDAPHRDEYIADIDIYECNLCRIVQNPDDFDHEGYYQNYQYSSGHSEFTKRFMECYGNVVCQVFLDFNHKAPESVLEIGSGDGAQLRQFTLQGPLRLKGIEPSEYLANIANSVGIDTSVALFNSEILSKESVSYDICLSSYTFDHVRNPIDYLTTAYKLLNDNGILAFEIHDLGKIIDRTEFCLFEHEHTIYLTADDAKFLLDATGFEVVSINPIPANITRGNSLIIIAKKNSCLATPLNLQRHPNHKLDDLELRIEKTIERIDFWIDSLPVSSLFVGFGAGGRGVMTLATLTNFERFKALFDSNYKSGVYLTPKTRIPVVGPDKWETFSDGYCLIFSFGYLDEIKRALLEHGFKKDKILSLLDFY